MNGVKIEFEAPSENESKIDQENHTLKEDQEKETEVNVRKICKGKL